VTDSAVFKTYDQASLDAQYNNRAAVLKHIQIVESWARDGQSLLAEFEHRLNVPYGGTEAEKLDIILPKSPAPHPINVYFHGGFWMSRSKGDLSTAARATVESGAITIVVGYALVPTVTIDELVRQCRAAVAWTHANAASLGGDPDRIFVSGNSAGGHLVAMLMATDWPAACGLPADLIRGGCSLSGVFDLEPIRLCYIQDTLGLTEDEVRRNSPINLEPATGAPLIVAVGGDESDEFHRQSQDLADAWNNTGGDCRLMTRPGINHFTIVTEFADARSDLAQAFIELMGLDG
jgi:arylformamidase